MAIGSSGAEIAHAQDAPDERIVSLEALLAHAERRAPALVVAERRRRYGDAAAAGADVALQHNPTLEFGIGPRFSGANESDFDFTVALGQPVEVAGEPAARRRAAALVGARLDAESAAVRAEVRRDVVQAYHAATIARAATAIAARLVTFSEALLTLVRRRLAAGDASAIDVRVAEIEAAQARQEVLIAEHALRCARLTLAELSGWSIETPPNVAASLSSVRPAPSLGAAMAAAADNHPALRARQAATAEAHARVEVAAREGWPAPVFGVQVAREGSAGSPANYIVLGTLGLALPLWQRNQGERARALVDEDVSRAEESVAARAVRLRIARAHAELSSAAERIALFESASVPALEDGLVLLERGFAQGEVPLFAVTSARARFVEAQRAALARAAFARSTSSASRRSPSSSSPTPTICARVSSSPSAFSRSRPPCRRARSHRCSRASPAGSTRSSSSPWRPSPAARI